MKTVIALTVLGLASAATIAVAAPEGHPHRAAMMERLKAADTNADGLISRTEAAALPRLAERFDQLDANRDGQVSFEELRAARGKHGRHGHGGMMKHLDADGDGKVSKAEALTAAEKRFDRVDADKDGFITREEAQAARKAHRQHAAK